MKLFNDIKEVLSLLTFIDYVFFFSIIFLFILIVVLIYFIKINEDVYITEKKITKNKEELEKINEDLKQITHRDDFTSYEEEQERRAIISYNELKNTMKFDSLNYEEEQEIDGLSVKKINPNEMFKQDLKTTPNKNYEDEEEYLNKLKEFNTKLK